MYIQWVVKGIAGRADENPGGGITKTDAFAVVQGRQGIQSNWWRNKPRGTISLPEVADILTPHNLDRHLHDYNRYGSQSPFISLAAGCVDRDILVQANHIHSAVDVALEFATSCWDHPGALFFGWVVVGLNPAVELSAIAEAVRDLHVYRRWSPWQLEGEITAKVYLPSNQIQRVEWWDPAYSCDEREFSFNNTEFVEPNCIVNVRDLF